MLPLYLVINNIILKTKNSGFTFSIEGANKKLFNVYYYNPLFYPYINDEMLWLPNFVSPLSFPYIFDLQSLLKTSIKWMGFLI